MNGRASILACTAIAVAYALTVLALHARYSPNPIEAASIAAGLHYRTGGSFSVGRVNPPLTHFIGTLAINSDDLKEIAADGSLRVDAEGGPIHHLRADFAIWQRLAQSLRNRVFGVVRRARLPTILWGIMLLSVVASWTRRVYGNLEAVLATLLVASDPLVLGLSAFVGTDIPCAATMLAAMACHSHWLHAGSVRSALATGLAIGVALSVKYTALCLLPAFLLLWLIRRTSNLRAGAKSRSMAIAHIVLYQSCSLLVVNAVYGWRDVGLTIHQLSPNSGLLQWLDRCPDPIRRLPIPIASEWLKGLDEQACDLENRNGQHRTYFRGRSQPFGTPWYYAYGFLVKTPTPMLLLVAIALVSCYWRPVSGAELDLIVPGFVIGLLISWQHGFNWHYRYILPALIPLSMTTLRSFAVNRRLSKAVAATVGLNVACSAIAFPESLSYFNSLAGGSRGGHWHLNGSEADWGHGLLLFKEWSEQNRSQRPLYLSYSGPTDPVDAGLPDRVSTWKVGEVLPQSGYLAISISLLKHEEVAFVEQLPLVAIPGGTFMVYRVDPHGRTQKPVRHLSN